MGREGRHILNRLRTHRRLMGFKQADVAHLLGLKSKSEISRWENGVTLPSIENLFKLSILYKTLSDELYRDLYKDMEYSFRAMKSFVCEKSHDKEI